MKKWLFSNSTVDPMVSAGLLTLRIGIGSLMISLHGLEKYQNFAAKKADFPVPNIAILSSWMNSTTSLACTIFAELICCAMIVVGFGTRLAAATLAFTMAIAAFVIHGQQALSNKELALLYLTGALVLLFSGPGLYSFDARFSIVKKRMFS
jgi:putative oxidoreductase